MKYEGSMMIYLGTSGWYYDDWKSSFYPEDIDKSEWLPYYATKFDTVEVNASFYRLPFKNMIKGWIKKTPDDFLLTFKGSQLVTHKKKLREVDEHLEKFFNRISIAEEKVGVILWQLPPSMKKNLTLLEDFLNKLSTDFRQCVEFRHKSWFEEKTYELLRSYKTGFCIISAPELSSTIEVTSNFSYIRWHGLTDWYQYNYSKNELNGWATQIKTMDVDDVFGYFNNDYHAFAPKNCMVLKEFLK